MKSVSLYDQAVISVDDLIEIAESALSPDELTNLPVHQISSKARQKAQKLLERWERLICTKTGEPENFNRRLASLALDHNSALERLQTRRCLQKENLPGWAKQLGRILNEAPYPCCPSVQNILSEVSVTDVPLFPEVLHPFINHYLNDFKSICSNWDSFLKQEVLKHFVHDLLQRLSFVSARTISADIKQQSVLGLLKGERSKDRYDYYVNQILGTPEGLLSLLRRYPVLGRLLATITTQAIENSIRWLERLCSDRTALAQTFNQGEEIGQVTNVELALSDPHNGGQTVWSVTFESGLRLAYKSRSLSMDVAYLKLLEWFNQIQPELSLRAAAVLPREDYGWVRWIEPTNCDNQDQVAQFYRRQGAHLAIFYLLGGTDFHEENFIPDGAWPIPIDLESIGSAGLTFTMNEMADVPLCLKPTFFSIASTGSLPRWIMSGNIETETSSIGGIAGRGNTIWPIPRPIWNDLATDQINITYQHIFCRPVLPLPTLEGKSVAMQPFLEQVLDGFTDAYRTFMANRDFLLSDEGVLAAFKNLPTRVLVRNTEEYNYLLFWSTAPDQLTSGQAYDIGLEIICGNPIDDTLRKDSFAFGNAEKKALWQRDIPYFVGSTSKFYFKSDDGTCFEPVNKYSGYEIIRQRLKDASELDMDWQRQLIRTFFEMSWISAGSPIPLSKKRVELPAETKINPTLVSRIEGHLESLGQTIANLTVQHSEGLGWLTMQRGSSGFMPYIFYPAPWNVSGAAGTAVFLANLAAYTGNASWHNLAIEAAKTSANMALRYGNNPLLANSLHCQGLLGLASVIYALTICTERLGDESCLKIAYDLVIKLSIQDWEEVENPDILTGSASSLLTLIHLYRNKPTEELLERVQAIGRGILPYQERDGINSGGFKVPIASHPLLGMAHGATGIAYALSSLYYLTKDPAIPPAILAALGYERSHYNQERQDWPNLQHQNNPQVFMTGWCAGAPGIGLALLGILARFDDNRFNDILMPEIDAACQATLRHLGKDLHHLCCGEAGRIIFLVAASQQLNRPELYQAACQATAEMLDFYEQKGFWKLQLMPARSIIPGLTDGVAGVGLALLTVIDPKNTSRFLTLE
ncbi:MAG TPA: type 2 lanthipeptide synthetase LanM family protein [Nodularia sp. (in: cyanobacteria)]|nr:type 2 lanthipeptide synthetase LanM family protein [Nodularia sp. (in: cyanobacteria)]